MVKMKLNLRNALKSTLYELASSTDQVLIYGEDGINNKSFCKPINIMRNCQKLLACTSIEIKSIDYYSIPLHNIVAWLKNHIREPTNGRCWWNLTDNARWLRYNIACDLYMIKLQVAKITYYVLLRDVYLRHFRTKAFQN